MSFNITLKSNELTDKYRFNCGPNYEIKINGSEPLTDEKIARIVSQIRIFKNTTDSITTKSKEEQQHFVMGYSFMLETIHSTENVTVEISNHFYIKI